MGIVDWVDLWWNERVLVKVFLFNKLVLKVMKKLKEEMIYV